MADPLRLMGVGLEGTTAVEICNQIDLGAASTSRLIGSGLPSLCAIAVAAMISGQVLTRADLVRSGFPPSIADELLRQGGLLPPDGFLHLVGLDEASSYVLLVGRTDTGSGVLSGGIS